MAKTVYTIRRGGQSIGLRLDDRAYVVGFKSAIQARYVMHNLHPQPEMRVIRNAPDNIRGDVAAGLARVGVLKPVPDIVIDVDAKLRIEKSPHDTLHAIHDGGFHLHTVEQGEFLSYPFGKSIGVVIADDIDVEDETSIVMKAHIVDPAFDPDSLRHDFWKSMRGQ